MAGNNIHSQLTDQAEIHVPKGFTEAANHTGLIKNIAGQLQWVDLDSFADQSNLTATVDPTPSNDFTQGYVRGSRWINTVQRNIFFCVDNTTGAAVWVPVIRTSADNVAPPTITDDASKGFKEGSMWIVTELGINQVWICADATIGAAEWEQLNTGSLVGFDHRTLSHMTAPADDHTQYIHIDGRRAMTGTFDVGGNPLINASEVNGQKIPEHNVVRVVVNPGSGEFASVAAAIASITSASASNPFVVRVGCGVFIEPQIIMKPYVSVLGVDRVSSILVPSNPSANFVIGCDSSTLSFVTISGVTGAGKAGVYVSSGIFQINNVNFFNDSIGVLAEGLTSTPIVTVNNSTFSGAFGNAVVVRNSGFPASLAFKNSLVNSISETGNTLMVSGVGSQLAISATSMDNFSPTVTAMVVSDGATLQASGLLIGNYARALYVPAGGANPRLSLVDTTIIDCTNHLVISHPGTFGTINATASEELSSFDPGTSNNLAVLLLDPDGEVNISKDLKQRQPDGNFVDITTLSSNASSMGILSSGDISPPVSGFTVTVEAGFGYLQKTDGSLVKVVWPDTPATIPASSTVYLYFDGNGTLQQNGTLPDVTQNIVIGRVVTDSTHILIIDESGFLAKHAGTSIGTALRNGLGAVYASGSVVAELGTRTLQVTPGSYYYGERNFSANGGTPITFTSFYQNNTGGFNDILSQTVVDNAQWDDGSGTLAPLGAGNYAKHSIYALGDSTGDFDSEAYFLVYSQAQYTALTLAEQGSLPNPPNYLSGAVALIASVIVQQGATHIVEVRDERPIISSRRISTVAATTFHSNLLGLTVGDDHPQYWRGDGTHIATGNFNLGTHNITNVGTINFPTLTASLPLQLDGTKNVISSAIDLSGSQVTNTLPNSKLATMAAHTVKANNTGLTASPSDVSIGNLTESTSSVLTITGGTNSVIGSVSIQVAQASGSVSGYLSSTDWTTFNNKQNALTFGNLTDAGTDGITITGGTGAVIGTGTSISQHVADSTHNGYLSSTDWSTFNNKQPAGNYITALTSDVTASGPGSAVATISNSAVTNAKMANMGAHTVKANNTGVSAAPSDVAIGNLTESTSSVLTITGGTNSVIGNVSIQVAQASGSVSGYLSSTDWTTFNNKQPAGNYITALTSDVTASGPGSAVATISNSAVTNAKMANMGAHTVKANTTASPAAPSDVSLGNVTESVSSILTITGGTNSVVGNITIQVAQASGSVSGYLSSTDWTTFNNKQPAGNYITALTGQVTASGPGSATATIATNTVTNSNLAQMAAHTVKANNTGVTANASDVSIGNLTESTSSVLTITGGTNSVIGNVSIQVTQASGSASGYLSSTDWTTFNNKQPAGNYITALTGEVTATGPGSVAATLSNAAVIGKVLTGFVAGPNSAIVATDSILTAFQKAQSQITNSVRTLNANGGTQEVGNLTLQNGKGVTVVDSPAGTFTFDTTFGPNELVPTNGGGLVLNYTAGRVRVNGTFYSISAGSLTLAANVTNGRVYVSTSGVVTDGGAISSSPPNTIPMAVYTTGASTITALADHRTFLLNQLVWGLSSDTSTILPNAAAAAGSTNKYSDAGHVHAIATAAAVTISSNANVEGAGNNFARATHTHQLTAGSASLDHMPQYDGSNWQAVYPEAQLVPGRAWYKNDDFMSNHGNLTTIIGDLGWDIAVAGAGGPSVVTSNTVSDSNHPGIIQINGNGGSAGILLNSSSFLVLGGGALTAEFLIYIPTLATITNDYSIRVGIGDSASADFTNGAYFEYTRATSTNWLIKTAAGGTRTSTTTATAVTAGAWIKLNISVNAAASTVTYSINGTSVGTISTNIPTAATNFAIHQVRSAGTAPGFNVDYFNGYQRFTTPR